MRPSRSNRLVAFCYLTAMITALARPAIADATLYDQLGGQAGLTTIVRHMVDLVTTDPRTKDDFDNINLDRLRGRIRDFLCHVADGPCIYKGRPMAAAHEGLDLTQAKFNAVAEDLQTAMEQVGIPYRTQNRLMARLAPLERNIVTK
ncbi:MAG TPA: group 1 truncated hemoglobin [Rhodopila sp.]|nr:group 1 truncated hemoglobin [Rhodopila sp.]